MGSADDSGGFDIRNFFKRGPQADPPPPLYHPYNFVPENPTSLHANVSASLAMNCQPYVQYSHENKPHPLQYSLSSPRLNVQNPITTAYSDGARLLAFLNNPSRTLSDSTGFWPQAFQGTLTAPAILPALPTAPAVPARSPSIKVPRGRHLQGSRVVYDVDLRLPGEEKPQLEVSPITVYSSDPVLVLGRQIAVNASYICYGLRAGTIRILNINTALRALLRGHTKRVSDMTFFSDDVHVLASASMDGRVFIRKIEEGFGDDGKMQITEQIVLAIQITGNWESIHPLLCWHSHNQDVLFVGMGKYIMKVDLVRARAATSGGGFSAEDPAKCHVEDPIEGVSCVGKHDGEVTSLSFVRWNTACLASASKDGMVQVWGDKKILPLLAMKPHDGQPVGSIAFLTRPHHPDHMVLLTAGPFNRELKLWISSSLDGWLSLSGPEKWQCIQTLELISSSEPRNEHSFFNQVLLLPYASLVLLANAKKNSIYVIHIEFGSKPAATHMDYLAEFSVTMPILSLTATNENVVDGEGIVQIYCVQTQAIQQHTLDLSQCLPPVVFFTSEGSSALHVCEMSGSSAFMPVEPSYGNNVGAATAGKPQGPLNTAESASSMRNPIFLSVAGASDTKFVVSVAATNPTEIANLSSEVRVPRSPRPPQAETQSGSSSRASDLGFAPVSSFGDQLDGQMIQGNLVERKPNRVVTTSAGIVSFEAFGITHKLDDNLNKDDERIGQINMSAAVNASTSIKFQVSSSPSHLITPSQLMCMVAPSNECTPASREPRNGDGYFEETGINTQTRNSKLETKDVNDSGLNEFEEKGLQKKAESRSVFVDANDKTFISEALESSTEKARDSSSSLSMAKSNGILSIEAAQPGEDQMLEKREQSAHVEEIQENKNMSTTVSVPIAMPVTSHVLSAAKGRKNKSKASLNFLPSSSTPLSPFIAVCDGEPSSRTTTSNPLYPSPRDIAIQVLAMQEALDQIISMQNELQKQLIVMVSVPIAKEAKKVEAALGQRIEKAVKANLDAMWARIQEENVKCEKAEHEYVQQMTSLLSSYVNKDLPATLEWVLKKEFASLGPATAHILCSSLEKTLSMAINDNFQKGLSDKTLNQLEKSVATKLEPIVSRQIQTQFQASGKQALQDTLRSCFEGSVVPATEHSCRAMFEQVDAAFQKGMAEHISAAQQHSAVSYTALAGTLKDTIASASSLVQSLKGDLSDGQHKLLALAEATGACSARIVAFKTKQSNGGFSGLPGKAISLKHLEESLDPTKELSRLVSDRKFEEAFHRALQMSDVSIVSWLSYQVDLGSLFSTVPLPLSQGVLLSLVQQLGCDIGQDTAHKLLWIREAAIALNPNEPILSPHMRPILEQLYQNLHRQMLISNSGVDVSSIRLVLHVVNSILTACK